MQIRVLIVDDHRMLGEGLVSLLLREVDLEVIALADSGPHALDVAEKERPDIAIVDVCMPGMNGFETAKQIRGRVPECRVIGLSAFVTSLFI